MQTESEQAWDTPEVRARLIDKVMPYLESTGWLRSAATKSSIDRSGRPLPWYTYSSIAFLTPRVSSDWTVFEFGSGNSTLWWASRTSHVTACEHDARWAERMSALVPANVDYRHVELVEGGAYSLAAQQSGRTYDVIVVDGRDRVNCAKNSLSALAPGGVFVWDNSNRDRYAEGQDFLREHGFKEIRFRGHGPINGYETETAFFYRPENCLGI